MHSISRIKPYFSKETCAAAVRALVPSRLDYADSLLAGLPEWMLQKLQVVQNNAARLMICRVSKHSHIYFTNAETSSLVPCQTKDQAQTAMLGLQGSELCRFPPYLVLQRRQMNRRLRLSGRDLVVPRIPPPKKNRSETWHLMWLPRGCGTPCRSMF